MEWLLRWWFWESEVYGLIRKLFKGEGEEIPVWGFEEEKLRRYEDVIEKLFDEKDMMNVRTIGESLTDEAIEDIFNSFLQKLRGIEEGYRIIEERFQSEEEVRAFKERVKEGIRDLLKSFDDVERYLDALERISRAHFLAGVEPRIFLVAYSFFQDLLFEKLASLHLDKMVIARSLFKKELLELTVILDNYWRSILKRLFFVERRTLIDSLTRVYNRRFLEVEFPKKVREEGISRYALVMIDLDNFKAINDLHGHLIGDSYLREFAKLLLRSFKGKDFVVRYGGDEFIVILTDVGKSLARRLIRRLAKENQVLALPNNKKFPLKFSWGISEFSRDSEDLVELIRIADRRMYAQKRRKKSGERS